MLANNEKAYLIRIRKKKTKAFMTNTKHTLLALPKSNYNTTKLVKSYRASLVRRPRVERS